MILIAGDTLLQQKLQESNSRLYADVGQTVRQVYGSASREVCWHAFRNIHELLGIQIHPVVQIYRKSMQANSIAITSFY